MAGATRDISAPFRFVTEQDMEDIVGKLYDKGFRGDELTALSKKSISNLESLRSAPKPQSFFPALAKAAVSSYTAVPGQMIGGLEAYTPKWLPGETGLDEMLRRASDIVSAPLVERWKEEADVSAQASPSLFSPEGRGSLGSMIGTQIPLLQTTAALSGIGHLIGGGLGLGVGLMAGTAIGGLSPDDPAWGLVGEKIGATLGRHGFPYAGLASMESKGFLEAGRQYFDDDLLEEKAKKYGMGSGLIEYVQEFAMLGKYTKLGKKVAVASTALRPAAKKLGLHALSTTFQAGEEWSQAKLFNRILDEAVLEQNERNKAEGRPLIEQTEIDNIKEDVGRAFASGAYLYNAMIAPAGAVRGARSIAARAAVRSVRKEAGQKAFDDMKAGKAIEDMLGQKKPKADTAPVGEAQRQKEAPVPFREWTPEQQRDGIENIPSPKKVTLATKMGIDVKGRGASTLVNDILQRAGSFKEGPVVMPEEVVVEPAPTPKPEPATAAEKRAEERLSRWMSRAVQRDIDEARAQAVLDHMEDTGRSPIDAGKEFWDSTYYTLPAATQQRFQRYVNRLTGWEPGSVVKYNPKTGEETRGNSWVELGKFLSEDLSNDVYYLEGTERGFVALMEAANMGMGREAEPPAKPEAKAALPPTPKPAAEQAPATTETVRTRPYYTIPLVPGHRRIKYVKPTINPVPEAEAERGKVIESAHRRALEAGQDILRVMPLSVHWDRRRDALAQAVGWDAAVDMINKEDELDYSSVMTRDQYATYINIMEGHVRDTVRNISGLSMENAMLSGIERTMDAEVDRILNLKPIRLRDGTVFDVVGGVNQFEKIPLLNRFISPLFAIEDIAHRLNMPSLLHIDDALMRGKDMYEKAMTAVRVAQDHINSKLPKALRKGLGGKRMRDYIHWLMTDADQKEVIAKQLGMQNNSTAMAKWVAGGSTLKDVTQIKRYAADQVNDRRVMYDWFVRNGIIHAERYRKNYAPVLYFFQKDSPAGDMSISEWVNANKNGDSMTAKLIQSMSQEDLKGLYDLTDTLAAWENRGYTTPGENPAFMEYVRKLDKEVAKTMAVATDANYVFDIYARRALQRMIFGDIAPAIASAMMQINQLTAGQSKRTAQMVFSHYLDTIAGLPDMTAKALQETKILPGAVVSVPIRAMNKMISKYNKLPFMPKIEMKDPEKGDISLQDAVNTTLTIMYASYLGVPNFTSPVKNLTQSSLSVSILGFPAFMQGLINLKKNYSELSEMGLRPEYARFEIPVQRGKGNRVQKLAKAWMYLYRMSDMTNVYGAASGGLNQWKQLSPPTQTDDDIIRTLFPGSKVVKLSDKEVMRRGFKTKLKIKGAVSQPLAKEIVELIRRGKEEDAKHLYLQYVVNLSQWRYGAGGTPRYLRNPLMKAAFMFSSWPANYVAYLRMLNRRGSVNLRADMRMVTAQLLFASAAAAFGYNSWKWILLGPLPEELIPFGPFGVAVMNVYRAMRSGGMAVQAMGTWASQEEEERARKEFQADLEALRGNVEDLIPWK